MTTTPELREQARQASSRWLRSSPPEPAWKAKNSAALADEAIDAITGRIADAASDVWQPEVERLRAENERLDAAMADRRYATVYERTAWMHDTGEHKDSEFPYGYCPRCEVEHPEGLVAQLRARAIPAEDAALVAKHLRFTAGLMGRNVETERRRLLAIAEQLTKGSTDA